LPVKECEKTEEGKEEKGRSGMKILLWASLIIAIIVAINELFWLGKTSLAWVIIGLAVAMGLQAVYLIRKNKD
jgi:uncharacterized membrane protein YoaK (UPF0700 family)